MKKENREYLNELIHDVSYEAVRQSLLDQLPNDQMDAKADELAEWIWKIVDTWRDREVAALGESFPVRGSEIRSLSEAQADEMETIA